MNKRVFLSSCALAVLAFSSAAVLAQDNKFRIGLILPMTGQQASTGRQSGAGAQLYVAHTGATGAGGRWNVGPRPSGDPAPLVAGGLGGVPVEVDGWNIDDDASPTPAVVRQGVTHEVDTAALPRGL